MKKICTLMLAFSLVFVSIAFAGATEIKEDYKHYGINVRLHSQVLEFTSSQPFIDTLGNRSYIPLPQLIEALNGTYTGLENGTIAEISIQDQQIRINSNTNEVFVNDVLTPFPHNIYYSNGEISVPAAFLASFLDYKVDWDYGSRSIVIYK